MNEQPIERWIQKNYPEEYEEEDYNINTYYGETFEISIGNKSLSLDIDESPGCCGIDVIHDLTSNFSTKETTRLLKFYVEGTKGTLIQYNALVKHAKLNKILINAGLKKQTSFRNKRTGNRINVYLRIKK